MSESLDAILRESEALLAEGHSDPGSPWRNPTFVTMGAENTPQARTVVLRRFDAAARTLDIHTDTRSAKFQELRAWPSASLHGWDASRQVQLRLSGRATLHTGDPVADDAWMALRPQSRATYEVEPGPGTVLNTPQEAGHRDDARAVFCVVRLVYETVEYLHLARDGHRRARFRWNGASLRGEWLVP